MSHEPHYLPHEHEHADAWHRHTTDEGSPQSEHLSQVNPVALIVTLGGMTVFTVGAIVVTAIYYIQYTENLKQELRETTDMASQQIEYRTTVSVMQDVYAWENAQEGTVRVPVSQAMERVVEDYQRQEARRDDG